MIGIVETALYCLKNNKNYDGKFDCSDFVKYCYNQNGKYNVPRTSSQMWQQGSKGDGSAGDIACWNGHVGICDGNGNVVHAYGSTNGSVRINKIDDCSRWDNRPVLGYRRYF